MPALTTVIPARRRLIALEDAHDWLQDAIDELGKGDVPAAVYAIHAALEHAADARDKLINLLVPCEEED